MFRDARRRIGEPVLVFLATLVGLALPYIGALVYLVSRPAETLEDVRSRRVELHCATPVGLPQVDLDAALTAEAKIALVDDTIPLVPRAEPRTADA